MSKIETASSVYAKIAAVQGELAKVGISKNRRNKQGEGYMFRGIDDVYAALSPLLAHHGLCVIPRVLERICEERQSSRGNPLFYVTVRAEFDFVSADDGSVHTAATFGEAMDSGDKATNKAMSAAYKYAAFMTFAIPTEGDNDADAHTPDVAARGQGKSTVSPPPPEPFPPGPAKGITELKSMARALWREIEGCSDQSELNPLLDLADNKALLKQMSLLEGAHREIWEGDGKDNPGIAGLITRKETEFAMHIADIARA